jgi:LmbE family N-acetylglucosaminyl deacetylase
MRAEEALRLMRDCPRRTFAEAFGNARLAILAPHPDDESLGCGGLIAEACAHGRPPSVMVLTDGAGSHPGSRAFPPDRLCAVRETETQAALARLGLSGDNAIFLRYPDTKAPTGGKALLEAAQRVAGIVRRNGCDMILTTWRHDPHGDHLAAARIGEHAAAISGARLLAYPVWGLTLPPDAELGDTVIDGFRLDIGRHVARKHAAILEHKSQYAGLITDDPDGFQLSPGFIELFLTGTETFLHAALPPREHAA